MRKIKIILISSILLTISLMYITITNQNQQEGSYQISYYMGNQKLNNMPKKDGIAKFDHGECDNDASIEWDSNRWGPIVKNLSKNRTKCSIYFISNFSDELVKCSNNGTDLITCMKDNAKLDEINLALDDTNNQNLRYIGATPNNYIDIGDKYNEDINEYTFKYNNSTQIVHTTLENCENDLSYNVENAVENAKCQEIRSGDYCFDYTEVSTGLKKSFCVYNESICIQQQQSYSLNSLYSDISECSKKSQEYVYRVYNSEVLSMTFNTEEACNSALSNTSFQTNYYKVLSGCETENIHSKGEPILWRIIGVMNNIANLDNGGQQESLVKIIRADSIGKYSWDSSASGINYGDGVNEWSEADLMKLLNPNTVYSGTPTIGGSLYWNRESGSCYDDDYDGNTTCNFTSIGISEEAKNKIAKIRWNTGTFATDDNTQWTAKATYEAERGSHNGKEQCEGSGGGSRCNDEVPRTTTWDGYIGLMYPSDFGYAVGGEVRETCLGKSMYSYNSDSCNKNDWLTPSSNTWTMTPAPDSSIASNVFYVNSTGYVYDTITSGGHGVQPVAYLKPSVKIASGTGLISSPFLATLD